MAERKRDWDKALRSYARGLADSERYADPFVRILNQPSRTEAAKDPERLTQYAFALLALQRFDEATSMSERAREAGANTAGEHLALGLGLGFSGHASEAVYLFSVSASFGTTSRTALAEGDGRRSSRQS